MSFENRVGEDDLSTLKYELRTDSPESQLGDSEDWTVREPYQSIVRLQALSAGLWTLHTELSDFKHERTSEGLKGRYVVQAWLDRDGKRIAAAPVRISITDDARPTVTFRSVPETHSATQPLTVTVEARDAVSGIQQVVVGFDANENQKLDDEEIAAERTLEIFDEPNGRWLDGPETFRFSIPAERLQKLADGSWYAWARATNGAGETALARSRALVLTRPKVVKPQTGSLAISFSSKGEKKVSIAGRTVQAQGATTIDQLPPGTHKLTVEGYGLPKREYDVTITVGNETRIRAD